MIAAGRIHTFKHNHQYVFTENVKTSFNIHSSGRHLLLYKLIVLGNQALCMCQRDLKKPNKLKPTYSSIVSRLIFKKRDNEISLVYFFDRTFNIYFYTTFSTGTVFKIQLIYHRCLSLQCYSLFSGVEHRHKENCFSEIKQDTLQQSQKFQSPAAYFTICTTRSSLFFVLHLRCSNHLNSLGF